MPTLTVYTAHSGKEADGSTSLAGHMYYVLTDSAGMSHSYGFAPAAEHSTSGPGKIFTDDDSNYAGLTYSSNSINLTDAQYQTMTNWATPSSSNYLQGFNLKYNFLVNSCVDFVWSALGTIGISRPFHVPGTEAYPIWNAADIQKAFGTWSAGQQVYEPIPIYNSNGDLISSVAYAADGSLLNVSYKLNSDGTSVTETFVNAVKAIVASTVEDVDSTLDSSLVTSTPLSGGKTEVDGMAVQESGTIEAESDAVVYGSTVTAKTALHTNLFYDPQDWQDSSTESILASMGILFNASGGINLSTRGKPLVIVPSVSGNQSGDGAEALSAMSSAPKSDLYPSPLINTFENDNIDVEKRPKIPSDISSSPNAFKSKSDPVITDATTKSHLTTDAATTGLLVNGTDLIRSFAQVGALDSNGDGAIDNLDAAWASLKVLTYLAEAEPFQPSRLSTLSQLGITSIIVDPTHSGLPDRSTSVLYDSTLTWASGSAVATVGMSSDLEAINPAMRYSRPSIHLRPA